MAFRDENDALRARIQALENENERLEDEKTDAEEQLASERLLAKERKKKISTREATRVPEDEASSQNEKLQAFIRGERSVLGAPSVGAGRRDADSDGSRLQCSQRGDGETIHVRRPSFQESLRANWWMLPVLGMGAAVASSELPLLWIIGFSLASLLVGTVILLSPPEWRLELDGETRFRLFKNKKLVREGPIETLSVRIRGSGSGPYHAEIGLLGEEPLSIDKLSRSDGSRLRDALARAGKSTRTT